MATVSIIQNGINSEPDCAKAIYAAILNAETGDILLIEVHDNTNPRNRWIPIEWFHDVYQSIRMAVDAGIIVVAAAGNGDEDLELDVYDQPPTESPPHWRNPLKRVAADSGSTLVGAGCPPNAPDSGPDLSRLRWGEKGASNYGTAVDAQGWGAKIVTTGVGTLPPGQADENRRYTDFFGLTSGASPMVAGALACVQGVLKAAGVALLTGSEARSILRQTGTPQQPAPGKPITQRIGNRPDLAQLIQAAKRLRDLC